MDTSTPVEIALSRTKTVVILLLGLAFVAVGVALILNAPKITASFPRVALPSAGRILHLGPALVQVVGGVSIAFFGYVAAFSARRLANPTPGLVLDARGLTDNTSAVAAGFIPWADVADVKTGGLAGQPFLYVVLRDPDAFLRSVSPVRRFFLDQNRKLGPSPVALTSASLDADFDEMAALVRAYREAHGPSRTGNG